MKNVAVHDAALWKCDVCGSWWCSQPALAATDFLQQLPAALAAALPWEDFRGWAVGSSVGVAVCPECGTSARQPLYGTVGFAARRQPMFALHAARGMSVRNMRQNGFAVAAGD
jgi:hypothetical protein